MCYAEKVEFRYFIDQDCSTKFLAHVENVIGKIVFRIDFDPGTGLASALPIGHARDTSGLKQYLVGQGLMVGGDSLTIVEPAVG